MPKLTCPQAQLAKTNLSAWLTTLSIFCFCALCSNVQVTAASIAITSPAPGSTPTLNCVVTVLMPATFDAMQSYGGPVRLQATDNTGTVRSIPISSQTLAYWDTTQEPNGSVTLIAYLYCRDADGSFKTIPSPPIIVAVKNGFSLNTDAAKTYAKVTLPTAGQSIVANGASFVITSDHQITWTRDDSCASYRPTYVFKQTCTYPNVFDTVVSGYFPLPQRTGDCTKTLTLGTNNSYLSGGPTPVTYYVYAFCYTPDQNSQVAQGSSTFTMAPIPK